MKTALLVVVVSLNSAWASDSLAAGARTFQIQSPRSVGEVSRVEINLEAGGELKVQHGDKVNELKMSVVGDMEYQERILAYPATEGGTCRSLRYYESAGATLKIGQSGVKPGLRDDRRLVSVVLRGSSTKLFCPTGALTRDELDLLNIAGNGVANSLALDRLLPVRPVSIGESWGHSTEAIGALLGLENVNKSDVESKLLDVTDTVARVQMAGHVEGVSDGSAVRMDIKAKYQVNLRSKHVSWLGLLVRESREIGEVVPGTDVVLRLEMKVTPIENSRRLTDAVVASLPREQGEADLDLEHRSADGAWTLTYGRDWYVTADERDLTVLKLMDDGQRIAQCNISSLAKVDIAKMPSLAEFQEEVRTALGKNFGEFVEAGQSPNELNHRVYRVVVRGTVNDLPIEWHYYLVANEQGQQAAFAFTIDAGLVGRLKGIDKQLVNQLRFVETKVAAKPTPAK